MIKFNKGLNIARSELPQVNPKHFDRFLNILGSEGVKIKHRKYKASELKPSQGDFDLKKIKAFIDSSTNPIIISSDLHVLDGHHRWASSLSKGKDTEIQVMEIGLPILDLIKRCKDFNSNEINETYKVSRIKSLVEDYYKYK